MNGINYGKVTLAKLLFITFFVLCSPLLGTQCLQAQELNLFKRFTINDGLKQRVVDKVFRDVQGRFWIVSGEGVQIFNGSGFETVAESSTIPFGEITEVHHLGGSSIYFKGDGVYYLLDLLSFETEKVQIPKNHSIVILEDRLYDVDETGVLSIGGNEFKIEGEVKKALFWNDQLVYLDNKGNLVSSARQANKVVIGGVTDLIGKLSDKLLFLKDGDLYQMLDSENQVIMYSSINKAIIRKDTLGQFLLATSDDLRRVKNFYLYGENEVKDLSFLVEKYNTIRDFYGENFSNDILLASYEGLIYQSYGEKIENLFFDKNAEEGSLNKVVWWSFYRERNQSVYFTTESTGVYKYDGQQITEQDFDSELSDIFRASYFASYDPSQDILVASSFRPDSCIWIWEIDSRLRKKKVDFRAHKFLKRDRNTYIIAGSKNDQAYLALISLDDLEIIEELYLPEIGRKISNLEINGQECIVSTNKGLFKFTLKGKSIMQKPFNIDTIYNGEFLDHLSIDDYILAGSWGNGLYVFQNDSLINQITIDDGLAGNLPHTIRYFDDHFWVSTLKGISVLDKNFRLKKNIRSREGLSTLDLNQHAFSTDGNHLYLGSINGLNKIDPSIVFDNRNVSVVPKAIEYDYEGGKYSSSIISGKIGLPFGVDSCYVTYDAFDMYKSYTNQDHLFKVSITEGAETRSIRKDRFPLKVSKDAIPLLIKNSGYGEQQLVIRKKSFLYEYGLVLFLTGSLLFLLYLLYQVNKERILKNKEQEIVSLKNRLVAMRTSALRSQMNPHFMFNALGSIQYYIQKEEVELAEEYLSDFAFLMRRILESSKEDFVKISTEIEMLKSYAKLEHMRFDKKFDYNFRVSPNVELSDEIPSMIIQPFIENAINHGIYNLIERRGNLEIRLNEGINDSLICEIEDNGVGRKAAKELVIQKHKSRSMQIVEERMQILSSTNNQNYSVDIIDKYEHGEACGTLIKLSFSLAP